jgi:4-carboxymuconolactone decarboxylase
MGEQRIAPRPVVDWDDEVRNAFDVLNRPASQDGVDASSHSAPNLDESVRTALAAMKPGASGEAAALRRSVPNIMGIYAWHPDLIRGWMPFSNHLRHSTLPSRVRELVILRTAWVRGGEYQWSQHTHQARKAGLTDGEIAALRGGVEDGGWDCFDTSLVRSVDEMCSDRTISDATWRELAAHLDRKQMIDLVFTVGAYDMHCLAFRTFGIQLDPGMEGFDGSRVT